MTGSEPSIRRRCSVPRRPRGVVRRRRTGTARSASARGQTDPHARWLTAGESHGPALVAILEGLPAHVQVTSADIAEALARRRLGFGRGARMKFEADAVTILGRCPARRDPGRPGRHPGRQHRVAQVGDRDGGRSGRRRSAGGPGAQRPADPAPAGARRPGRHAEVRLRRGAADPGAGQRPRDGRPGRAGSGGDELPAAGVRRHPAQPRRRARHGRRAGRRGRAHARRPGGHRRRPAALLRPETQRRHVRRGRGRPERRRHPRRGGRGGGLRACRRGSVRTCTGTGGWTRGWPPR